MQLYTGDTPNSWWPRMSEKFLLISIAENCGILPGKENAGPNSSFQENLQKTLVKIVIFALYAPLWLVIGTFAQKWDTWFSEWPRNWRFSTFEEAIFSRQELAPSVTLSLDFEWKEWEIV